VKGEDVGISYISELQSEIQNDCDENMNLKYEINVIVILECQNWASKYCQSATR